MSKPKQFTDFHRANILIEKSVFIELQRKHGNFSDWVRQKAEEDLTAQNDIAEVQLDLNRTQQKKKEAEILKQKAEDDERALQIRLNSLKTPSPILRKIQEEKLDRALKIIANAQTPARALELAEAHEEILRSVGLEITAMELINRIDSERNGMFR